MTLVPFLPPFTFKLAAHLTYARTARQLPEAFPSDEAPLYLIHDRSRAFDGAVPP
ncbi:MAG: hypothetical protein ABI868_21145 [Acidobacteriota bacterium]